MKKLIMLCAAVAMFGVAFGQSKEAEAVKKRLEKAEVATADAKKGATAGAWIEKANVLVDAAIVYTSKLIQGFSIEQAIAMIGQPKATVAVDFKGESYNKYEYANFDVYVNNQNQIVFWEVTNDVVQGALQSSFEALVKAKSIAPKDFTGSAKGVTVTNRLKTQLQSEGMAMYSMNRSAEAAKDFELSVEAGDLVGTLDTAYLYYAGVAYVEANNTAKATPIFEKLLNYGRDQEGMVYYYLSQIFMIQNDSKKAIELLEAGFKKYPSNPTLITSLINAFIVAKEDPTKIVAIVKQAQQLDPKNTSLYLVESSVYNEIGDKVNAYKALESAQEIDPTYYDAFYNYGIMKILEAEDVRKESDKIDLNDAKAYDAAMANIVQLQKDAISKLEKAHELNPTNFDVADLLRQLYFPTREENAAQYEKYLKLSEELKN